MGDVKTENIAVNGVTLHTARQGKGKAIVLCHGGPGGYDDLGPVADMIDDLGSVRRYDQRGSGRSERRGPYDVSTFVDDLEALRARWRVRKWVVGGHSWGASLALVYAARYPSKTRALIYINGTGIDPRWRTEYRRARLTRLTSHARTRFEALERLRASATDSQRALIAHERQAILSPTNYHDPDAAPELTEEHDRLVNTEVNALVNEDHERIVLNPRFLTRVAQLPMPTLVVHGASDPRPAWSAEAVARTVAHGEFVSLPDVGHYPWVEKPELLRSALRGFLHKL
jgi:proline iminopeptidase